MSHEERQWIILAIRYGPAILFAVWVLLCVLKGLLFDRKR